MFDCLKHFCKKQVTSSFIERFTIELVDAFYIFHCHKTSLLFSLSQDIDVCWKKVTYSRNVAPPSGNHVRAIITP